jgi:hypothetical protein
MHLNFLRGLLDPVARTLVELAGMLGGFCAGRKPGLAGLTAARAFAIRADAL